MSGRKSGPLTRLYRGGGKRCLDVALSVPLLLVLSAPMLLVALLVKLDSRGPVFFVQPRLGRGGRVFSVLKFRTMTARPRTRHVQVFDGDPEVTRVGRWLRRLKIDEWPQFWNIVRGEMSLVGPRPGLPEHKSTLDDRGRLRLEVRPGLTGLAQVHGNIHLSWPHRWCYDARYVDRISPALDLWIVSRTVLVVTCGEERFLRQGQARKAA